MRHKAPLRLALDASAQSMENCSDDELMQLVRAGTSPALAVLVQRHQPALRAYCVRRCGAAVGEDVAQEVFVTLWRARDRYEPRGRFRAYLFTLAERRCRSALQRAPAPARDLAQLDHEGALPGTQLEELLTRERRRRLFEKVARLPEPQRRAVLLRYTADLDYDEIAEVLGRSPETVRSRVFLGLRRLRKWVGDL